ncbi:MAG: DUF6384 family protein [Planctomycetota bacterium]
MNDLASRDPQSVPELLRIMDVATALRRERERAERELAIDETKDKLRERLRAAARESGDPVSDAEIETAIAQYFRAQFEFADPKPGWRRLVALSWIHRGRVAVVTGVIVAAIVGLRMLVFAPGAPLSSAGRVQRATEAAHAPLSAAVDRLRSLAKGDEARAAVDQIAARAASTYAKQDVSGMESVKEDADALAAILALDYVIRVISRPGEHSGIDAYYEDAAGKRVSGYYLVVEAFDGRRVLPMSIADAELQKVMTVRKWGEQVPKAVYDRIAADKQADGIVDDAVFARKTRGTLHEVVEMKGEDGATPLTRGRRITTNL